MAAVVSGIDHYEALPLEFIPSSLDSQDSIARPSTPEPKTLPSGPKSPTIEQLGDWITPWDDQDQLCSPSSVYSESSIRFSSQFSVLDMEPPSIPAPRRNLDLEKIKCVACRDPSMVKLNGIELVCGHFAHKACMKASAKEGFIPSCSECGKDCVVKAPLVPRNAEGVIEASTQGHGWERDVQSSIPLQIRAFVKSTKASTHEIMVEVCAESRAYNDWRYKTTEADMKASEEITADVFGVALMGASNINPARAGRLRLASAVRDLITNSKITAYLFEQAIILTRCASDGFEELIQVLYLGNDDTEVLAHDEGLEMKSGGITRYLIASRSVQLNWLRAVRDLTLRFPIAPTTGLGQPITASIPTPLDRCLLHLVICLPYDHLEAVPYVLSQMGPFDRLGLVVSTPNGASAWLGLHRPGWTNWATITRDPKAGASFELFTPTTKSILDTAEWLFDYYAGKATGVQRSIALVAGCPLASTRISRPVHVVGIGRYDFDFLTSISEKSGGQFYHSHTQRELNTVLAGIAATERTYTHHDVRLTMKTETESEPGMSIVSVLGVGEKNMTFSRGQVELYLGSLVAGQSRTVLVEVTGDKLDVRSAFLSQTRLSSVYAITNQKQLQAEVHLSEESAEFHIFFDRMARIAGEILSHGIELVAGGQSQEFTVMLSRAIAAIGRAIAGYHAARQQQQQPQPLFDLTDPHLTGSTTVARAEILARGLSAFLQEFANADVMSARAILFEASSVIQNQRAVTQRTLLEQVYQEQLATNQI